MGGRKKNKQKTNTNKQEPYGCTWSPFNRPGPLNVTCRSDAQGKLSVFVCFQASGAAPRSHLRAAQHREVRPGRMMNLWPQQRGICCLWFLQGRQQGWLAGWLADHTWTLLHNLLTQPRTTSPANDQQCVDCWAVRTSGTPELTFFLGHKPNWLLEFNKVSCQSEFALA